MKFRGRNLKRHLIAFGAGTVAFGLVAVGSANTAMAVSYRNCAHPYVCLYNGTFNTGTKSAQYRDALYQNHTTARQNAADSVVNTRNDDSVWLIDTGSSPDRYICIPANARVNLGDYTLSGNNSWANDVDTIRIWTDNGRCGGTTGVTQGSVPDFWIG
jgi:hypothetical protein